MSRAAILATLACGAADSHPLSKQQRFAGTGWAIQTSYRSPSGRWLPSEDISPHGVNSPRGPGVAVDEHGNAVAIWGRTRPDLAAAYVQTSRRRQASGAWEAPTDIAGPFRDVESPEIAVDAVGNAIAAWIAIRVEDGTVRAGRDRVPNRRRFLVSSGSDFATQTGHRLPEA